MKIKKLFLLSFICIALVFVSMFFCGMNGVYAEPTPSYIKIGTTEYSTIAQAVNAASNGDEIHILGDYEISSKITITKNLSIIADGNSKIRRELGDADFNLFEIQSGKTLSFLNPNEFNFVLDGNRTTKPVSEELYCSCYFINNGTLNLENLTLANNRSNSAGCVYNTGTLNANKCNFYRNNVEKNAGAIFNAAGMVTLTDCSFEENSALFLGGAILNSGGTFIIDGCSIINNIDDCESGVPGTSLFPSKQELHSYSFSFGGAICCYSGNLQINNCDITGNNHITPKSVVTYGGAIGIVGGNVTISGGTTFENNTCQNYGGAIGMVGGSLVVDGATFDGNSANTQGGALYVSTTATNQVSILDATFENNTAGTSNSQDVFWKFSGITESNLGTYLANNVFNGQIVGNARKAIFFEDCNLPVGENFALAEGCSVTFDSSNKIYVKEKLLTTNKILLTPTGNLLSLGGKTLVTFVDNGAVPTTTGGDFSPIFILSDSSLKLVPKQPNWNLIEYTGAVDLFVQQSLTLSIYKYKEENGDLREVLKENVEVLLGGSLDAADMPEIPTREGNGFGWRFDGWAAINPDTNEEEIISLEYVPFATSVVYGAWTKLFTVTFVGNDNSVIDVKENVPDGSTLSETDFPEITVRADFDSENYFYVWTLDASTLVEFDLSTEITNNTSIYVVYVPKVITLTFVYENGVEETREVPYNSIFSEHATAPDITPREGYSVNFWAREDGSFAKRFVVSSVIKTPETFYEIHVIDTFDVTYILKFYKGDEIINTETHTYSELFGEKIEYGSVVSENEFPRITDERFSQKKNLSWNYQNQQVKSDLVINGTVDINEYEIRYKVGETILTTEIVKHGDFAPTLSIQAKEGYNKVAPYWTADASNKTKYSFSTPVTSNLMLSAVYTINEYTVKFVNDAGDVLATQTVKHGGNADTDGVVKLGFAEVARFDKPTTNITEDTTITAWKVSYVIWIIIGVALLVFIIALIIMIRMLKKKKSRDRARSTGRINPYI